MEITTNFSQKVLNIALGNDEMAKLREGEPVLFQIADLPFHGWTIIISERGQPPGYPARSLSENKKMPDESL